MVVASQSKTTHSRILKRTEVRDIGLRSLSVIRCCKNFGKGRTFAHFHSGGKNLVK